MTNCILQATFLVLKIFAPTKILCSINHNSFSLNKKLHKLRRTKKTRREIFNLSIIEFPWFGVIQEVHISIKWLRFLKGYGKSIDWFVQFSTLQMILFCYIAEDRNIQYVNSKISEKKQRSKRMTPCSTNIFLV